MFKFSYFYSSISDEYNNTLTKTISLDWNPLETYNGEPIKPVNKYATEIENAIGYFTLLTIKAGEKITLKYSLRADKELYAQIDPKNSISETDETNNISIVSNTIIGDLNSDGEIFILDLIILANHYGLKESDTDCKKEYDLVPDSIIDIFDLVN